MAAHDASKAVRASVTTVPSFLNQNGLMYGVIRRQDIERREQVGFLSSWKLHRKLCFCICWCADFAVIRQPCRWVPFHVGSAGAKRQIRCIGSKTMILLTRRLMPAELRLQSDRETQKSEIYFTDYTLAGQPGAYSFWKSDRSEERRV